jgi:Zn-dependent M28 family amino/carboxypeptidase
MKKIIIVHLFLLLLLTNCSENNDLLFDGESAYQYAKQQVEFGPRTPGSDAHQNTLDWIMSELNKNGWKTDLQTDQINDYQLKNIIAYRGEKDKDTPWIILAAHYDSRFFADRDPNPENQLLPVPGANDGASGVAVLLELARVLPIDLEKNVWLVFFDAEDQGQIDNWDWILGSRSFVDNMQGTPDYVVLLDMIGDADLNIYFERNSNTELQQEIWRIASELGYSEFFIPEYKYSILDDHIPFVEKGITAIDIIDFDYPYWHTIQDSIDKVSPESLEMIGRTIFHWLLVP